MQDQCIEKVFEPPSVINWWPLSFFLDFWFQENIALSLKCAFCDPSDNGHIGVKLTIIQCVCASMRSVELGSSRILLEYKEKMHVDPRNRSPNPGYKHHKEEILLYLSFYKPGILSVNNPCLKGLGLGRCKISTLKKSLCPPV